MDTHARTDVGAEAALGDDEALGPHELERDLVRHDGGVA